MKFEKEPENQANLLLLEVEELNEKLDRETDADSFRKILSIGDELSILGTKTKLDFIKEQKSRTFKREWKPPVSVQMIRLNFEQKLEENKENPEIDLIKNDLKVESYLEESRRLENISDKITNQGLNDRVKADRLWTASQVFKAEGEMYRAMASRKSSSATLK